MGLVVPRLRCVGLAAAIAASLGAFSNLCAKNASFVTYDSKKMLELKGVWRSRGYGYLWEFKKGEVQIYDVTQSFCTEAYSYDEIDDEVGDKVHLSRDGKTVRFSWGDPDYLFTFDKVDGLQANCTEKPKDDPISVFDALVETFSEHYAFFDTRQLDWQAEVREHRRRVVARTTDRQLFRILSDLLSSIDDAHVGLRARIDGERIRFRPKRARRPVPTAAQLRKASVGYWTRRIGHKLVTGRLHGGDEDGRIRFGLIGSDIGYLYVSSTGWALGEAMDDGPLRKAQKLFKGKKALIVDVSRYFGGTDRTARRFASLFATTRTLGYYKYATGAKSEKPQAVYVDPSDDLLFSGPIFLITGPSTMSAAEILAMCMRALPNVTHIGAATRGSLSDVLFKTLPNDWSARLSNEIYLDADKKAWEGKRIPPQIEFVIYRERNAPGNKLEAARGVVDFIRTGLN